jgi:hypothetical protein
MPPKQKLRSVKPTAKETIAALEAELQAAKDDAASWKKEAADAEKQAQEAIALIGCSRFSDLIEAIKDLRKTLGMEDEDKRYVGLVAQLAIEAAEDIARYEKDKESAEADASALGEALSTALEDRDALLKHAGLSARAWWSIGGAHEAQLDVRGSTY